MALIDIVIKKAKPRDKAYALTDGSGTNLVCKGYRARPSSDEVSFFCLNVFSMYEQNALDHIDDHSLPLLFALG